MRLSLFRAWPWLIAAGFASGLLFWEAGIELLEAEQRPTPPELEWFQAPAPRWDALEVPARGKLEALRPLGAKAFEKYCASCHGKEGKGDGVLAPFMPFPPRNFAKERFRMRSVRDDGRALPEDLYRTISSGIQAAAMPSFEHLPVMTRWALVARVAELSFAMKSWDDGSALRTRRLAPRDGASIERGKRVFKRLKCGKCHGAHLRGNGIAAADLKDDLERPIKVPNLSAGRRVMKSGGGPEAIARIIQTGLPGTPMPSFASEAQAGTPKGQRDISDLAYYIDDLTRRGDAIQREAWSDFYTRLRGIGRIAGEHPAADQVQRQDPEHAAGFALAKAPGCVSCHEGIAPIATGTMAIAISAFGGGDKNRRCVVCHEGDAAAQSKIKAHRGMITNPGSLWVTSVGFGCGKCHSDRGVLKSLHARALPEGRGGSLMSVVSTQTDPSGKSGSNHAYRMQRGLMALEMGKVTHFLRSAGILKPKEFRYADFDVDDTDGAVASSGTDTYRTFMAAAKKAGKVQQVMRAYRTPSFAEAKAIVGPDNPAAAAYADTYRKDCGRCHLWSEGKSSRGEHRSAGCAACHIVYGEKARYRGADKAIAKDTTPHMSRHQIVLAPPVKQCNHCHTRGSLTEKHELHSQAGLICADCHTSIDVHGDGNIYPTIPYQLEVRCEDCHGTAKDFPWELPIGRGNGVTLPGPRGVYKAKDTEFLLTSRGNPKANWVKVGKRIVIEGLGRDALFEVIPLKTREAARRAAAAKAKAKGGKTKPRFRDPANAHIPEHDGKLECYACHNSKAPLCISCHMGYFEDGEALDWVQSGLRFNPVTGRQVLTVTPGRPQSRQRYGVKPIWKPGVFRKNRRGRLAPYVEGCRMTFTYISKGSKVRQQLKLSTNPGQQGYPTGLGPTMAHEWERPLISCAKCHVDPDKGTPPKSK